MCWVRYEPNQSERIENTNIPLLISLADPSARVSSLLLQGGGEINRGAAIVNLGDVFFADETQGLVSVINGYMNLFDDVFISNRKKYVEASRHFIPGSGKSCYDWIGEDFKKDHECSLDNA